MTVAGESVNLESLRESLALRGVHFPRGGKHPSMMRLWLEKAGVFVGTRWQIDEDRVQSLLGVEPTMFGQLQRFSPEQRAFLLALANSGARTAQRATDVAKLAAVTYGVRFSEKNLPKSVLNPLVVAGYIAATKTTGGRGAKSSTVKPTKKLVTDIVVPMLEQLKEQIDPKLLDLLRKPLAGILVEIASKDRYVAGLALEALAFKLMQMLDMGYLATRLRAQATGGAEVDLIFQSARLVFSRWQVQCKNTAHVSLDDVAKEVGLTHFLKSTVIVIVSTGAIGVEARRYANKIMTDSNLSVVMIDRNDLKRIQENAAVLVEVFNREALSATSS